MAESGWLTRSLEQNLPYNIEYPGKIQPEELKIAFLSIIDAIEENGFNCKTGLLFIFMKLAELRDKNKIELAKPTNLAIKTLIGYLCQHFYHKYDVDGAARLPVLAIYAIYQCMLNEVKRYEGKLLLDIASHTSADSQSGQIGDINIKDEDGRYFEGVEVKHGIPITNKLVKDAFSKFCVTPIDRYYILSTSGVSQDDSNAIEKEVERIRASHGCQVIVNGIVGSLNYYIRLLNDPCDFIEKYVVLVQEDKALKYEHRVQWNKIVTGLCMKQG